ncbi:MAG: metallophosphoesterase [Planctomycetes bacterium]|nr:metallophosphoesterase [Planctomycetota bacterium]
MIVALILCVQILVFATGTARAQENRPDAAYSFVYLGDLHFDRMSHHDLEWVKAKMPGDLRQIEDYTHFTRENTPGLLKRVQTAAELSDGGVAMVVQGGDFVEGLCGTRELQELQFKDALDTIRDYIPKLPFLAAKGNHDITGPGAKEAYDRIMLPWLSRECGKQVNSASFSLMQGPDLFIFFDAYHDNSLDWLERTLKENQHRHALVVMHPPAVPYDARASWHRFSQAKEKDVRERFLRILGADKVVLLTAHLHKFGVVVRRTAAGPFVQFSMNSVISSPRVSVKNHREGLADYGPALVELEPQFQPETREERRTLLEQEKPHILRYEYADFPGYAVVHVADNKISADIYLGSSDQLWKTVTLVPVPDGATAP